MVSARFRQIGSLTSTPKELQQLVSGHSQVVQVGQTVVEPVPVHSQVVLTVVAATKPIRNIARIVFFIELIYITRRIEYSISE